jgi:hypothetical protein
MAKANRRGMAGKRYHTVENDYKIPINDRKEFMGNNSAKWVSKEKYDSYWAWKKKNK